LSITLLYAAAQGVWVQIQVDWRKMTLTHSDNYLRIKRAGIELLGVFCTPQHPLIEVAPDMHNKFILFGDADSILGSFNITFDRWGANWESGMTFRSQGLTRLLDNIFQSIRGGRDSEIPGRSAQPLQPALHLWPARAANGKYYRPHHAILAEINRAQRSIRLCLFLLGEMVGEHNDSVIDAFQAKARGVDVIQARARGVDVQVLLNGHLARQGNPGAEYTLEEELRRPLSAGSLPPATQRHACAPGLRSLRPARALLPDSLQVLCHRRARRQLLEGSFQLVQHLGLFA
jgi:phosphatidylserine/phosphatidylglycerophosphate/cardiolipin synthase-like enzyme